MSRRRALRLAAGTVAADFLGLLHGTHTCRWSPAVPARVPPAVRPQLLLHGEVHVLHQRGPVRDVLRSGPHLRTDRSHAQTHVPLRERAVRRGRARRSLACGREPAGRAGLAAAARAAGFRDTRPQEPGRARAAQAFTFVMRGITRPPDLPGNIVWVTGPPAVPRRGRGRAAAPARDPALFIQASGGELTYAKIGGGARAAAAGGDADPASAAGGRLGLGAGGAWLGSPASSAAGRASDRRRRAGSR